VDPNAKGKSSKAKNNFVQEKYMKLGVGALRPWIVMQHARLKLKATLKSIFVPMLYFVLCITQWIGIRNTYVG